MADPYNLRKRGKFWVPDFTLYGIRVHRSTKCVIKADAVDQCDQWAQEIRDRANGRTPLAPPPEPPRALTLRDVWHLWERIRKPEVSWSHWNDMRLAVEVHAAKHLDTPITSLTRGVVNEIRSDYLMTTGKGYKRDGGHTVRTHGKGGANQMVKQLYVLCSWAWESEFIPYHPFKIKRLKVEPKEKSVLWPEQASPFLAAVDRLAHRRYQPLKAEGVAGGKTRTNRRQTFAHGSTACRLMAQAGLREDEARTLEWPNIDWRNQALVITSAETLDGEGSPKDRETRTVGIPPGLLAHLRIVWEENGKPTQGLVLVSTKHGEPGPHASGFTTRVVERAGLAIGVPGLTPQALRRTFATGHYEIGTPIKKIAEMLGHANEETTRKHYIVKRAKDHAVDQRNLETAMGLGLEIVASPPKVTQIANEPHNDYA